MARSFSPQTLTDDALVLIAARFKALSDPFRLKLIIALEDGEMSLSQLAEATGKMQTYVARHLNHLMDGHVVARRQQGPVVRYHLADRAIFDLCRHVCRGLQRQHVLTERPSKSFGI